jgi:hypothetical protein
MIGVVDLIEIQSGIANYNGGCWVHPNYPEHIHAGTLAEKLFYTDGKLYPYFLAVVRVHCGIHRPMFTMVNNVMYNPRQCRTHIFS